MTLLLPSTVAQRYNLSHTWWSKLLDTQLQHEKFESCGCTRRLLDLLCLYCPASQHLSQRNHPNIQNTYWTLPPISWVRVILYNCHSSFSLCITPLLSSSVFSTLSFSCHCFDCCPPCRCRCQFYLLSSTPSCTVLCAYINGVPRQLSNSSFGHCPYRHYIPTPNGWSSAKSSFTAVTANSRPRMAQSRSVSRISTGNVQTNGRMPICTSWKTYPNIGWKSDSLLWCTQGPLQSWNV